jgi:hypothetical protein
MFPQVSDTFGGLPEAWMLVAPGDITWCNDGSSESLPGQQVIKLLQPVVAPSTQKKKGRFYSEISPEQTNDASTRTLTS